MGGRAERMPGKAVIHVGKARLADQETKDSKPLAVKLWGLWAEETPSPT